VLAVAMGGWHACRGGDAASLARSSSPEQRLRAVELIRASDPWGGDGLLRDLADDADPRVRVQAIRVLGRRPGDANTAALRRQAEAEDPAVRSEALAAMGGQPGVPLEQFTGPLRSAASPEVRAAAARALAQRKDHAAAPALLAALEDPDPRVRMAAIQAVNELTIWRTGYEAEALPGTQRQHIQTIRELLARSAPQ